MDLMHHHNLHRINPADLELERRFIHRLTPRTKRLRLLAAFGDPSDAQLIQLVSPNPETDLALAWVQTLNAEFDAVARYSTIDREGGIAEFAIVVADALQAQGIGRKLLGALIHAATSARLRILQGDCYAENRPLISLCESMGFKIEGHPEDASLVRVTLHLQSTSFYSKGAHPDDYTRYQ